GGEDQPADPAGDAGGCKAPRRRTCGRACGGADHACPRLPQVRQRDDGSPVAARAVLRLHTLWQRSVQRHRQDRPEWQGLMWIVLRLVAWVGMLIGLYFLLAFMLQLSSMIWLDNRGP